MKSSSWRRRFVLLAFLIILLVLGLFFARKFFTTSPSVTTPSAELAQPKQFRDVVLYFGSPDGSFLVAEGRQIEDCLNEEECLRRTVQALVNGPATDLIPIFPLSAQIRSVTASVDTVTVDFSRELVSGHPGGSVSELLTIYGLANSLAENFPHLRRVRVLVEGAPLETLKGHVDLREPVKADFGFTHPPEGSTQAKPTAVPGRTEP